jgi:predicted nuclease with TOPRIM domain
MPFTMETLEMEARMDDWSDDKLDHLDRRVDEGFKRMDKEFEKVNKRFEKVDARVARVEQRLAKTPTREEMNHGFGELRQGIDKAQAMVIGLNRTLIAGAIGVIATLIGFHG